MLTILTTGDWRADQVHVRRSGNKRVVIADLEPLIDSAWEAFGQRPGVHLFDGPMARLASYHAARDRLDLEIGETSYKAFIGTNISHPEWIDEHGREVMADPLGISPLVLSVDGYLLLGRRQSTLALYPNRIHPFAGAMEPKDAGPVEAVRRELREELSLDHHDLAEIRCIGLAEDSKLHQCESIFIAHCRLTRDALTAKLDAAEHHDAWSIPATSDQVADALRTEAALTPIACATLLLWGRIKFGHAWFEAHYEEARR